MRKRGKHCKAKSLLNLHKGFCLFKNLNIFNKYLLSFLLYKVIMHLQVFQGLFIWYVIQSNRCQHFCDCSYITIYWMHFFFAAWFSLCLLVYIVLIWQKSCWKQYFKFHYIKADIVYACFVGKEFCILISEGQGNYQIPLATL